MDNPNNDNAILFATYITLYMNDATCTSIHDIARHTKDKDKETQKIYRALKRRADTYLSSVRNIAKLENLYFLSELNEVLDGYADEPMTMLEKSIRGCLRKYNVYDDGIIYKTIIAHILSEVAVDTTEHLCNKLKEDGLPYKGLLHWKMEETRRVTRNFYCWVCRKVDNEILKEISGIVTPIIIMLTTQISHYQHFEKAYEKAISTQENNE